MQERRLDFAALRMLAWKEWREWKWPFALYTVALLGQYLLILRHYHQLDDLIQSYVILCWGWGWFAPMLVAIKTAHGERMQKTLSFSSALPCSLRTTAWMRLAGGAFILIGPQLVGALLLSVPVLAGWREIGDSSWYIRAARLMELARALPFFWAQQVGVMVMISIIGAKRRGEVEVGAFGVAFTLFEFVVFIASHHPLISGWKGGAALFGVLAPITLVNPYEAHTHFNSGVISVARGGGWLLALHLLLVMGLGVWFSRRYGGKTSDKSLDPTASWYSSYLGMEPFLNSKTRAGALIWLHLRQALPLTFAGVASAILTALVAATAISLSGNKAPLHWRIAQLSLGWIYGLGVFWPLVIGAGLFASELRRDLGYFWRSRPIHPAAWFWLKFVIGLVAVVGSLDLLPAAIAYGFVLWFPDIHLLSHSELQANLACLPIFHAECYSLAVLGVSWIRKPMLGAGICFLAITMAEFTLINTNALRTYSPLYLYTQLMNPPPQVDVWHVAGGIYLTVYGTVVALTALAAFAASRAARRPSVQPLITSLSGLFERTPETTKSKPSAV